MTETYGFFGSAEGDIREYEQMVFAQFFSRLMRDGIFHGVENELAVSASDPPAMTVSVGKGMAFLQGYWYRNDAPLTVPVPVADPTYPRIDRIVLHLDVVGSRVINAVCKFGTPAASPVPPTLTRTAETWELSLAQVRVEAGATSIIASKITDERGNASLCGVAAPLYVPSSQLEVTGAVNMQGQTLTGLPVPSAATDAARRDMGGATLQNLGAPTAATDAATKGYVDTATLPKLSQLVMDADKNCNRRNFTNLGYIAATRIRSEASDTVRYGPKTGNISLTIPSIYMPGSTVRIKFHVVSPYIDDNHCSNTATLKVDGVVVATVTPPYDAYGSTSTDYVGDHTVNGGSTITLTSTYSNYTSITISCTDTAPVTYPAPPTWPA